MTPHSSKIRALCLIASFLWWTGIIAAPYFKSHGNDVEARFLYALYGKVCHQSSDRSFYLWGEQCAVCIRCTAIYTSFLLGTLFIFFTAHYHRTSMEVLHPGPLTKYLLLVAGALMLVDVGLSFTTLYKSSTASRILSGMCFGLTLSWFLIPLMAEAVSRIYTLQRK
ncbi:MAG: DUF2085 domain-containing protein [Bacteroidetes bacterium]|nr:DUF2085 domain-containing protein [Bacteroidota bacterium]